MVGRERGSVHVFLLLLFVAGFVFALGLLGLGGKWSAKAHTQLRLDECAGRTAHELRSRLEALDSANTRIRALRTAIAAATAATRVETATALRRALGVQVSLQNAERMRWRARRALWLARRGCEGGQADLAWPLPAIPWKRPPPDPIGPRPLEIPTKASIAPSFRIEVRHEDRIGAARVELRNGEWVPRWGRPRGPGFR